MDDTTACSPGESRSQTTSSYPGFARKIARSTLERSRAARGSRSLAGSFLVSLLLLCLRQRPLGALDLLELSLECLTQEAELFSANLDRPLRNPRRAAVRRQL